VGSRAAWPHVVAFAGVVLVVAVLRAVAGIANETTAALVMLLVVLFAARQYGSPSAVTAAVAGTLALNYFFFPPVGTLDVSDPLNLIALIAFLAVALTVGGLSARVRRRASEAEASRGEAERLYRELQDSFEREAQAEALRRSEHLKSTLVDAVTHELRTPLTSIKASTSALLRDDGGIGPEARQELLEIVDQETDRLNGLVEELVGAARLESHALALNRSWTAPDEVIADAVARVMPRLRGHRIDVHVPVTIPSLLADARAISEVVFQLLENAAKYAPANSVIRVSADAVSEETIEIRVEDEGPGVPLAERPRIFERFYRAPGTAGSASGLGMGLAIAHGLVEAHGGTLDVGDRSRQPGARFTLRLPIGDADDAARSGLPAGAVDDAKDPVQ